VKRILFVDDETELLDSLRARLYKRRSEWEMVFVDSGGRALQELEKRPVDLIVSDVRMPGMDGGELLSVLRERWPQTIRIVLSGYVDQMKALKLVSLAQQYISKPCDAQCLENVIERCFNVRERLHNPALRSLVGGIRSLPPAPKIYSQLAKALSDNNVSVNAIADLVAHDPVIAAKMLQVTNSGFFRLAKPMTSVRHAVSYLGFNAVSNLVLSAEVFAQWRQLRAVPGFSVDRLQEHALKMAAACQALCVDTPLAEDAWLAGLLLTSVIGFCSKSGPLNLRVQFA
jgi:CheY-like chemotaxis protein